MEPYVQQALLTDIGNVLQHLAREIPTELVAAGATAHVVERAKVDAQTIVKDIVADMSGRDIDILLHFDPMSLALQFIGADDRAAAFAAADGPYLAFREQYGDPLIPDAPPTTTRTVYSEGQVEALFDLSPVRSETLFKTAIEIAKKQIEVFHAQNPIIGDEIRLHDDFSPSAGRRGFLSIRSPGSDEIVTIRISEYELNDSLSFQVYMHSKFERPGEKSSPVFQEFAIDDKSIQSTFRAIFQQPGVRRALRSIASAA